LVEFLDFPWYCFVLVNAFIDEGHY